MKQYLELLKDVLENGKDRTDRTGVGTRSVFGRQMRIDLDHGFPLLTTKKVHFKSVVVELLWFLRGDTNIRFLKDHGVTIWDEWADAQGELGPVYGKQWRRWEGFVETANMNKTFMRRDIDQIANLVADLTKNPFSRRHIVSAWNPADVPQMKLPPCHTLWQCYVTEAPMGEHMIRFLSLHLYARSIDIFLGLPFNIASYALLTEIMARAVGMIPSELIISFGDLHLYKNHFDQAREQLSREPKELPDVVFDEKPLEEYNLSDFALFNYEPHPAIKAPIAV